MAEFDPVHPGEILEQDFREPLGLSRPALAEALGVPVADLAGVLDGRQPMTGDLALRLARYFGTTPEFWMGLQSTYDLETARDTQGERIAREVTPRAA